MEETKVIEGTELHLHSIEGGSAIEECDGCGHKYAEKEKFVTGIESCCGQCHRTLCADCVKKIYMLIQGK